MPHEVCYHCGRPKEGTMARTVSTETRQDLLQAVRERVMFHNSAEPVMRPARRS